MSRIYHELLWHLPRHATASTKSCYGIHHELLRHLPRNATASATRCHASTTHSYGIYHGMPRIYHELLWHLPRADMACIPRAVIASATKCYGICHEMLYGSYTECIGVVHPYASVWYYDRGCYIRYHWKVEIQDGDIQTGNTYVSEPPS